MPRRRSTLCTLVATMLLLTALAGCNVYVVTIASFTATPDIVSPGQEVTLAWTVRWRSDGYLPRPGTSSSVTVDPGGIDASDTSSITVAPSETTTYTLTVAHPGGTSTDEVIVVVDSPPTITRPDDQTVVRNTLSPNGIAVPFAIGDAESAPESLTVTALSGDQSVVDDADLAPTCTGGNCRLEIVPDASRDALVTVTLTVDDGRSTSSSSFLVEVASRRVRTSDDSGAGSLRDALAAADPGDVIGFDPAAFSTEGGATTVVLTSGALVIDRDVTVEGPGRDALRLSGDGGDRVFEVVSGVSAYLSHLTVTGGDAVDGGGILNRGALVLGHGTLVMGNRAENGGGILNSNGSVVLEGDSAVVDNEADAGGGIYNFADATLTMRGESVVGRNRATAQGGGILNFHVVTLAEGSRVIDNGAALGGGIFIASTASLTMRGDSAIAYNDAGSGGGVYNFGTTTLAGDSAVSGNEAVTDGGGVYNAGTLTLNGGTVTGNAPDDIFP